MIMSLIMRRVLSVDTDMDIIENVDTLERAWLVKKTTVGTGLVNTFVRMTVIRHVLSIFAVARIT